MAARARSTAARAASWASALDMTKSSSMGRFAPDTSSTPGISRRSLRAAMVQLPACRSVKMIVAPLAFSRWPRRSWMSSPHSPFTSMGSRRSPRPVTASTAEISPAAKSPWPATSARFGVDSLMVLTQVPVDLGLVAHLLDQRLVEPLGGIDTAPLQEMMHRDHLRNDRDVLPRIERNRDARDRHAEDVGRLAVEPRPVDDGVVTPLLELHDHLDALLLPHGADAEDRRDVDETESADLHVVPLKVVPAADEDVTSAPPNQDQVVGDDAVAALDEIEYTLRLADAALADEQQPDAVDVSKRAMDRRLRGECVVEPGLDPIVELVGLQRRAQDRDVRPHRFLDDVGREREPLRDEDAGHRKAEELRDVLAARLLVEGEEVGDLCLAEHLHAPGDESLDVA